MEFGSETTTTRGKIPLPEEGSPAEGLKVTFVTRLSSSILIVKSPKICS